MSAGPAVFDSSPPIVAKRMPLGSESSTTSGALASVVEGASPPDQKLEESGATRKSPPPGITEKRYGRPSMMARARIADHWPATWSAAASRRESAYMVSMEGTLMPARIPITATTTSSSNSV